MRRKYDSLFLRLMANCGDPAELGQNESGCWPWLGGKRKRYGRLNVRRNGQHVTLQAHRAIAEEFIGRPLRKDESIEHICYFEACGNPDHYELMPMKQNSANMQARRRGLPVVRGVPLPSPPDDDNSEALCFLVTPGAECPF